MSPAPIGFPRSTAPGRGRGVRVVVAPDKFRGTVTAPQAARALGAGARRAGAEPVLLPMADGGEGSLDAFGGPNRADTVTGPLGRPVEAAWRFDGTTAVVEACLANGLALAGGAEGNDALGATTRGVGELLALALDAGARRIVVAVGGSASTDGGAGAVGALGALPFATRGQEVEVLVACDVETRFLDAPTVFGPQKGASASDVVALRLRLEAAADRYLAEFGVDVREIPGAGAAGGLAGGLAALGARLVPGALLIAAEVGLGRALVGADLVLTGEGRLDGPSFEGKTVGTVARLASDAGVPTVAIVGTSADDLRVPKGLDFSVVRLDERFGADAALGRTAPCLTTAALDLVRSISWEMP